MVSWVEGFQQSIDYIEGNLASSLEIEDIARTAMLSPFYYQRMFGALCGMTVGEYIRGRRMTLAAQELAGTDAKVIDVALKYGYDSPDSFAKAFQRFHGIQPSKARENGAPLRSLAPLHIKVSLEGGSMMDYRIVEKAPFTIVGVKRPFNSDTSYQEIPKFWDEWLVDIESIFYPDRVCFMLGSIVLVEFDTIGGCQLVFLAIGLKIGFFGDAEPEIFPCIYAETYLGTICIGMYTTNSQLGTGIVVLLRAIQSLCYS